jgi:hypothetical protein
MHDVKLDLAAAASCGDRGEASGMVTGNLLYSPP